MHVNGIQDVFFPGVGSESGMYLFRLAGTSVKQWPQIIVIVT
jgi:hypothetical protein